MVSGASRTLASKLQEIWQQSCWFLEHARADQACSLPEEAYRYLSQNAVFVWGDAAATRMEPQLQSIANAMAVVSALDIPDEVEPLFGEDIDRTVLL